MPNLSGKGGLYSEPQPISVNQYYEKSSSVPNCQDKVISKHHRIIRELQDLDGSIDRLAILVNKVEGHRADENVKTPCPDIDNISLVEFLETTTPRLAESIGRLERLTAHLNELLFG